MTKKEQLKRCAAQTRLNRIAINGESYKLHKLESQLKALCEYLGVNIVWEEGKRGHWKVEKEGKDAD